MIIKNFKGSQLNNSMKIDILDYSKKSVLECSKILRYPLELEDTYCIKMQDLETEKKYNFIWFINSLYILNETEIRDVIVKYKNFLKEGKKKNIFF